MQFMIVGTDTDVGKTIVSAWLCLHTRFSYFKPVQSGSRQGTDSETIKKLANVHIYPEKYVYPDPYSPHLAAKLVHDEIILDKITLPQVDNLIIEGAGGLLVPLNAESLLIDWLVKIKVPVILVSRSTLGTINHTLLSLEALRQRDIEILGVIVNGELNLENYKAIEYYGKINILACLPHFKSLTKNTLQSIPLTNKILEAINSHCVANYF